MELFGGNKTKFKYGGAGRSDVKLFTEKDVQVSRNFYLLIL